MAGVLSSRTFVAAAVVAIVGVIGYATMSRYGSGGTTGAVGTSGEPATFGITTSQLVVTVENRSRLSMFDIRIGIVPVGRATTFTTSIGRMDPGEKRDIPLANLRGRDGTPFNLRVHRPTVVEVTATDINRKEYKTQADWE